MCVILSVWCVLTNIIRIPTVRVRDGSDICWMTVIFDESTLGQIGEYQWYFNGLTIDKSREMPGGLSRSFSMCHIHCKFTWYFSDSERCVRSFKFTVHSFKFRYFSCPFVGISNDIFFLLSISVDYLCVLCCVCIFVFLFNFKYHDIVVSYNQPKSGWVSILSKKQFFTLKIFLTLWNERTMASISNSDCIPNANSHRIPNAHSHRIPTADSHRNPNADSHIIPNADSHIIPNAKSHRIPNANSHCIPNGITFPIK